MNCIIFWPCVDYGNCPLLFGEFNAYYETSLSPVIAPTDTWCTSESEEWGAVNYYCWDKPYEG